MPSSVAVQPRGSPPAITRPPRSAKSRSARASSGVIGPASITATVPLPSSEASEGASRSARTGMPLRRASSAHAASPSGFVANDDDGGPLGLGASASTSAAITLIATTHREHREARPGGAVLGEREPVHRRPPSLPR